jgi:protein O-mannosyl-transferase
MNASSHKTSWFNTSWAAFFAASAIALATMAAYANSINGSFIFDDLASIPENPTIRRLGDIENVLSPPPNGETVSERPLLNLSFAINYAFSGFDVQGYHLTNLVIHALVALVLFGVLRRTLLLQVFRERWGEISTPMAFAAALLWAVHPLQTESVTYIVQRAESLAGLFYLLTLYCVIRGAGRSSADGMPKAVPAEKRELGAISWYIAAVFACLLGMATKEIVVTAPLIVLLYDRTFLSGSFRLALRRRWGLYLGLAACWGLLAYLIFSIDLLAKKAGQETTDPWSYARSQPGVILYYLRLCLWPYPLCLDYDWPVASAATLKDFAREVLPGLVCFCIVLALTLRGLTRRNAWGFLGAWFLLILAPTSSIVPLVALINEHRLYLPLAAVTTGVVACAALAYEGLLRRRMLSRPIMNGLIGCLLVLASTLLAVVTYKRNENYIDAISIWQATVAVKPSNSNAYNNIGVNLTYQGRWNEAMEYYQKALDVKPQNSTARYNLANALLQIGKIDEAISLYRQVLDMDPMSAEAHNSLGNALSQQGEYEEALQHYQTAARIKPDYYDVYVNINTALCKMDKPSEAADYCREAIKIRPDLAEAYYNLGFALCQQGKMNEGIDQYRKALEIDSELVKARNNLGSALMKTGKTLEAIEQYRDALRINANDADVHFNLGISLGTQGEAEEAIRCFQKSLDLRPDYTEAHINLGVALYKRGSLRKALSHWHEALRYQPDNVSVLCLTAWTLATAGDATIRDGNEALVLALRAEEITAHKNTIVLDTLAAAYAEAGKFNEAAAAAQEALGMAAAVGDAALADALRGRIARYLSGKAYHEEAPATDEIPAPPRKNER